MTHALSSLADFDQFLTDHSQLAPDQWNPVKRDAFAAACLDRLASSAVWEFGARLNTSWETILAAGLEMPVAIAATMVASGHHRPLMEWRERHARLVPSLATAAAHPLSGSNDQWHTALHALASASSETEMAMRSLAEVLALGVDVDVLDSEGMTPLGWASDLNAVKLLLAAGANPNHMVQGRHALDKALSAGYFYASKESVWRRGWSQLLSSMDSPSGRQTLAFVLTRAGRTDVLEDQLSHWGWSQSDLDAMTQQMDSKSGRKSWTWTGWVAYHALLGIRQGCEKQLQESLLRLGEKGVAALPEWDRMWLAVAVHLNRQSGSTRGLGATKVRWSVPEPVLDVLKDEALMTWAHNQSDLPLITGGLIRYRALRDWLVEEGLLIRLGKNRMDAGAWRLYEQFLLEDIKGNERMDVGNYKRLRESVLATALTASPEDPLSPPLSLVVLSLVRCLEHATTASSASLPDFGTVFRRTPDPLAQWVRVDFSSVSWSPPVRQAIVEGHDRLDLAGLEKMFSGMPDGHKWSGLTHALASRVNAAHLEASLPTPTPARRAPSRF